MYIPNANREDDLETLVAFIRANSFITFVSVLAGQPYASHIPVAIRVADQRVTITGHLARQNPHCQALGSGESLAIFTGPHSYISPSLYESHESVPTWNYIAVHASGTPTTITFDDPAAIHAMIETMIDVYDPDYQAQWASLSTKYRDGMLKGIVGFEMHVTRLEGKYKLSQNRSIVDQHQVANALASSSDPVVAATGVAMQQRMKP